MVGHCSVTALRDEVRRQIMPGTARWSGHRKHPQRMKPQPRISRHPWMFAGALALLVASWGCNDDEGTQPPPPDTTPPAVITDLRAGTGLTGTIELTWTAPGDDGSEGQAGQYAIRYSADPMSEAVFDTALSLPFPSVPRSAGQKESLEVADLAPGIWHFGVKAADEIPNWSALSNVASTTVADTVAPSAVSDLRVDGLKATAVLLAWTAPGGDDEVGQATNYDLRYAQSPLDLETWEEAFSVSGLPDPAPSGSSESFLVSGLLGATTYYFGLRSTDAAGNWSELSNEVVAVTDRDTIPPDSVSDLRVIEVQQNSITLSWTAPGDDGVEGQADRYDLRYSRTPIDDVSWDSAVAVRGVPRPGSAGTVETMRVSGLETLTEYHFALRVADAAGNPSTLSNRATHSTSRLTRLTTTVAGWGAFDPRWSPDGSTIAVSANFGGPVPRDLFLLTAETGEPIQLTHSPGDESHPCWSPDGTRLVYVYTGYTESGAAEIWTIDAVVGAEPRRLYAHGERDVVSCDWSRDGTEIVFVLALSNAAAELWTVSSDGGSPQFLAGGPHEDMVTARWSPNGDRIVFDSTRGSAPGNPVSNIWMVPASGGDPVQITFGGTDVSPAWSPDSQRIAFGRGRSGPGIWTMSSAGLDLVSWSSGPASAGFPSDWSQDGTRVCFTATEGPSNISDVWILYVKQPESRKR